MNISSSGRGQSFEEDIDNGDRGEFTGNPRLEMHEEDDERCILDNSIESNPECGGGEMADLVSGQEEGHLDNRSVDSIQVYRDSPPSNAALLSKLYQSEKLPELDKRARNQLVAVSIVCALFMIGEIVGGVLSNSVAIMTDALHLASDLTSFIVSLISIYLAVRRPTKTYTFGLYRAEVIGATLSIVSIWLVTGILSYLAIRRIVHEDFHIQSDDMLITAACCVLFNIIMALVLNVRAFKCSLPHAAFGHSHGNHSHGNHSHDNVDRNQYTQLHDHSPTRAGNGHGDQDDRCHGDVHERCHGDEHTNINVKAAFVHVIGDLIQSLGVLIAALIIKFRPDFKIADPICTLIFAVLVLITTVYMLRDILSVVLEATPRSIPYVQVLTDLRSIAGVKLVRSLHMWSLTLHKTAASVHMAIAFGVDSDLTIAKATRLLKRKYGVSFTTVQVVTYRAELAPLSDSLDSQHSEPI